MEDICGKCVKIVKSGVQCSNCKISFHFRCGKIDPAMRNTGNSQSLWLCDNYSETTNELEVQKVVIQELKSENASLKLVIECLRKDIATLEKSANGKTSYAHVLAHNGITPDTCPTKQLPSGNHEWRQATRKSSRDNGKSVTGHVCALETKNRFEVLNSDERNESEVTVISNLPSQNKGSTNSMETLSVSGKKTSNRRPKLHIFADSHGRDVAKLVGHGLATVDVTGTVKPGAPLREVTKNLCSASSDIKDDDFIVIIAGTNDIACNEASSAITALKKTLPKLAGTNVVVVNAPRRYDLSLQSCVNLEVKKTNNRIAELCEKFNNVEMLDMGRLGREMHTRHGLHLNRLGKTFLSSEIVKLINKKIKDKSVLIPLPYTTGKKTVMNTDSAIFL